MCIRDIKDYLHDIYDAMEAAIDLYFKDYNCKKL
jgi:hypothetical protein